MSKVEDVSPAAFTQVRSRWDYLKKRLLRRGVVEVNESHPHHLTLEAMKAGIKTLLTEHPEAGFKENLTADDYAQRIKFDVSIDNGKTYKFESFASPVFACLRAAVDVSEEDFLHNLAPSDKSYLEFISNSRSGQHFYFSNIMPFHDVAESGRNLALSHTQRFILKTDKQHCIQYFLSILRSYIDHFLTYPHSLLVKFLGLYSIKGPSLRKKKYFLVMQSVFYPTVRLQERYDLKGCLYNRFQEPNPPGRKTIIVYKDKNFLDQKIEIGAAKDWFMTQLRADVDFLITLRVLDYSLLLGSHELHVTDRKESVGNLVVRMKKSFGHDKSSVPLVDIDEDGDGRTGNKTREQETSLSNSAGNQACEERTSLSNPAERPKSYDATSLNQVHPEGTPLGMASPSHIADKSPKTSPADKQTNDTTKTSKTQTGGLQFLRSLSNKDYLDSTGMSFENRRLLANCDNALHIIDGPRLRYYVGVIDFFTRFQCRQRVGKFLKDLKTCCGNHSTEHPDVYAEKFYNFICERVV